MSLSEAMLELADEMETITAQVGDVCRSTVESWAKQIRRLCKAAANRPAVPFSPFDLRSDPQATKGVNPSDLAATQKALQRLQARQQQMSDHAELEEGLADNMRLCVDGPEEGTHISCPPDMKTDQQIRVGGEVYVLRSGKLYWMT
jgi:hypothetical protein